MKKLIFGLMVLVISTNFLIAADTYVNGYTKSNGTNVDGYYRTSPNSTKSDNYSTVGNTNPYTGQAGTKQDTSNYYNSSNSNSNTHNNSGGYGYQNPYSK